MPFFEHSSIAEQPRESINHRLVASLQTLFPEAKTVREALDRFAIYVNIKLPGSVDRETRRALLQWAEKRLSRKSSGDNAQDAQWADYVQHLSRYQTDESAYQHAIKQYERAMDDYQKQFAAYEAAKKNPTQALVGKKTSPAAVSVHETEETIPTLVPDQQPMPPLDHKRSFIPIAETEKAWDQSDYAAAVKKLEQEATPVSQKNKDRGDAILTKLLQSKRSISALLTLVSALIIAGPRGEREYAAGVVSTQEASSRIEPPKKTPKPLRELVRAAPLETAGHALRIHLGNGRQIHYQIPDQTAERTIRYELGRHYTETELLPGEVAAMRQQIDRSVVDALRLYEQRGLSPEAVRQIIDHIQINLRGSASMDGSLMDEHGIPEVRHTQDANFRLAGLRLQTARQLYREAFDAHGLEDVPLEFHLENEGAQGDPAEFMHGLTQMGIHIRHNETWTDLIRQMAHEQNAGDEQAVQQLVATHGGAYNPVLFHRLFSQNFDAHRRVTSQITIAHRDVFVSLPTPAQTGPVVPTTNEKSVSQNLFVDAVPLPSYDQWEFAQTSGQLHTRKRNQRHVTIEDNKTIGIYAPIKPMPPLPPEPPIPPELPTIVKPQDKKTPAPSNPTAFRPRKPLKPGRYTMTRTDAGTDY